MDLMQEVPKKNTYNGDLNRYSLFNQAILYEKQKDHEQRLTDVEREIMNLSEKLIHSNDRITNDDQFLSNEQNARLDDYVNRRMEDKRAGHRLENIVLKLMDVDDKTLQVQIVGEMVEEIKGMLKDMPKQKNNYRRKTLLMLHEALKQNYTKKLFTETQVKALTEVARVCNRTFVTKDQYYKTDDVLCECGLDMMPNLE